MAKYPYIVNKNGIWYPAGTEVPEGAKPITTDINEDDFSEHMNPPQENNSFEYTKTEINRMSTAELREVAKSNGIDNAEDITGGELKKILIEKFEL